MTPEEEAMTPRAREAKSIAKAEAAEAIQPIAAGLKRNNVLSVLGAIIVLGSIAGGILATQSVAKGAAREELAPVKADTKSQGERLDFFKDEFKRHLSDEADFHATSARTTAAMRRQMDAADQNQDLVLDALKVPKSKRAKADPE